MGTPEYRRVVHGHQEPEVVDPDDLFGLPEEHGRIAGSIRKHVMGPEEEEKDDGSIRPSGHDTLMTPPRSYTAGGRAERITSYTRRMRDMGEDILATTVEQVPQRVIDDAKSAFDQLPNRGD